ncbi:MAG: hypothetical protein RQ798_03565 [Candidatus Caldarchaeales archaeon]|nr:hypothetical protein [Candidatus Caldarchaeales archaeon]MDT7915603.1 hypothetical protein [Candidatus Caldarchaeales archaeon]
MEGLGTEGSGGSMVFVPTEHYGELIREMRRLGVAPDMLVEILRELERSGLFEPNRSTLASLREALARWRGMPKPSELGEAVARVLLAGGSLKPDDLELAAEALHGLARMMVTQSGSLRVPERAREIVARAALPALQNLVVPRWVYGSLERSLAQARERLAEQELEIARLKGLLKRSGRELPVQRIYVASGLLDEAPLPLEGEVGRIACPVCRELNLFHLPSREACGEAEKRMLVFRLHCSYCGRPIDIEPQRMVLMIERGGEREVQL